MQCCWMLLSIPTRHHQEIRSLGSSSVVERQTLDLNVVGSIPTFPAIRVSSNGRTADFGSAYRGSNPCTRAVCLDHKKTHQVVVTRSYT